MARFIKPDFNNNIINISATIAEFLGCPNDKPTLPALSRELAKGYKNVVFVILDGMGVYPVEKNLAEGAFFKKNTIQVLTSVFPSTTTNATTTYLTDKYPMEHGWFGWSLYLEELGRAVDIYPEVDSETGEHIEQGYMKKRLPVEPYYKNSKLYATNVVVPEFFDDDYHNRYVWESVEEIYGYIAQICKKEGRQFVYTYCTEPDSTMHRYGVTSPEARRVINALNDGFEGLCGECADTLFIISADHGQIDIDGCIELYKDGELLSMLEWQPFLEARATAFKVKPQSRGKFIATFNKKYGTDFELFKTEELIKDNYFGGSGGHAELLGDFIAVGKTNKIFKLHARGHDFKGHHTSLTEEMEVPLILASSRTTH